MSRSATPATRNEATTRLKPPKRTTSAKLPIGTAIWSLRGRLRTVALVNATSSEHTLNSQTPRVKREPLLRIREKLTVRIFQINIVHSDRESSPWPYSRTFWYHGLLWNKMLQECSVFLKEPIPLEYVVFPKSHDHDCKCHTSRSNVCYLHCRIFYVQKTSKKTHADRIWRPRKHCLAFCTGIKHVTRCNKHPSFIPEFLRRQSTPAFAIESLLS